MPSEDLAKSPELEAKEILRIAGQALKEDTVQIFEIMFQRLIIELGEDEAKRIWRAFAADFNEWEEKQIR